MVTPGGKNKKDYKAVPSHTIPAFPLPLSCRKIACTFGGGGKGIPEKRRCREELPGIFFFPGILPIVSEQEWAESSSIESIPRNANGKDEEEDEER
jgi:hypothetical protein